MDDSIEPVVFEKQFHSDLQTVWNALTVRGEMVLWYFDNIPDFQPEVGFQTSFPVKSEERIFTHQWKILEVEPLERISYEWTYKEYPGRAVSLFELAENNESCRLKVSFSGLSSFPPGIPEFQSSSCRSGWAYFLGEQLSAYLDGRS